MDSLEQIKICLNSNSNLNDDIRNKFYLLTDKLIKKIPNVNLIKLGDKLKTVKISKSGKYERKGVYFYDVVNNNILFSSKLEDDFDIDELFMKALLEMSTSTGTYTGFNSDERLLALNQAYTEMLANNVIGNEGESELEEEILITNLISHLIGNETLFNSYFSNDGMPIIKAMQDAEVGLL